MMQLGMGAEFEDISTAFYDLPTTTKRRSRYLIPGMVENKLRIFDLSKVFDRDPSKKLQHDFIYNRDYNAPSNDDRRADDDS